MTENDFVIALNKAIIECCKASGKAGARYVVIVRDIKDVTPTVSTNIGDQDGVERLLVGGVGVVLGGNRELADSIGITAGHA